MGQAIGNRWILWRRRAGAWAVSRDGWATLALLVVALATRLPLMGFRGFYNDMSIFVQWGVEAQTRPLLIYSYSALVSGAPANYPPLAIFLYGLLVALYDHFAQPLPLQTSAVYMQTGAPALIWLIKLPVLLGDLALLALLYALGRRQRGVWGAWLATLTFALCPAVLLAGILWGQFDNLVAFLTLLAFALVVDGRSVGAGVALALAMLLKPTPVIFAPLLLVALWRWQGRAAAVRAGVALVATGAIFSLPYAFPPQPQLLALYRNILFWFHKQPQTSVDAYNLWALLGIGQRPSETHLLGPLTPSLLGWGLFAVVTLLTLVSVWRGASPVRLYLGAAIIALAFFDLTTGQHERYLYPALPFLLAVVLSERPHARQAVGGAAGGRSGRARGWTPYTLWALYALVGFTFTTNLLETGFLNPTDPHPIWLLRYAVVTLGLSVNAPYQAPIAALNLLALAGALAVFLARGAAERAPVAFGAPAAPPAKSHGALPSSRAIL